MKGSLQPLGFPFICSLWFFFLFMLLLERESKLEAVKGKSPNQFLEYDDTIS